MRRFGNEARTRLVIGLLGHKSGDVRFHYSVGGRELAKPIGASFAYLICKDESIPGHICDSWKSDLQCTALRSRNRARERSRTLCQLARSTSRDAGKAGRTANTATASRRRSQAGKH